MLNFIGNFIQEIKWRKEQGVKFRPIWQMILMLPFMLVYWPAKAYIDWVERTF